jgi:L-threonylcarbamoyladenylate synthase
LPTFAINANAPDLTVIARAAELLRAGELVGMPTETVYGLAANGFDAEAVQKIFIAKQRPSFNPIILHVADELAAQQVVAEWPKSAVALAKAFWPGPLTLVLPRRESVPAIVTAGLANVGVRVPAHPVAQLLLRRCAFPLAAPSANRYMQISPSTAHHVSQAFGDGLFVLDGGSCAVGIESTVVDLTGVCPKLLRPGGISRTQIEAIVGPVTLLESEPDTAIGHPSPGLSRRHYAPRAALTVAETRELPNIYAHNCRSLSRVGLLLWSDIALGVEDMVLTQRLSSRPELFARQLYAALHALDDAGCQAIIAEALPADEQWQAVADRLQRAAQPQ